MLIWQTWKNLKKKLIKWNCVSAGIGIKDLERKSNDRCSWWYSSNVLGFLCNCTDHIMCKIYIGLKINEICSRKKIQNDKKKLL